MERAHGGITLNLTEQEANYVLQTVMQRPLAESLLVFLKMTNQKLVPADAAQPVPIRAVGGVDPIV
jgi:hypothetical protein